MVDRKKTTIENPSKKGPDTSEQQGVDLLSEIVICETMNEVFARAMVLVSKNEHPLGYAGIDSEEDGFTRDFENDPYYQTLFFRFEGEDQALLIAIRELKRRMKEIDITKMEDLDTKGEDRELLMDLIKHSIELFDNGIILLSRIGNINSSDDDDLHPEFGDDQFDDWGGSGMLTGELKLSLVKSAVDHKLDEIVYSQRKLLSKISDNAFVVLVDLRNRVELLKKLLERDDDNWNILSQHDRCLRCFIKSASAIEAVICKEHELPNEEYESEVELAIRVRGLMVKFMNHAGLLEEEEKEEDDDEIDHGGKIFTIGNSIGRLRTADDYQDLRTQDRKVVTDFQKRINKWLKYDGGNTSGKRLLSDIKTSFELFFGINNRAELIDSDRIILEELYTQYLESGADWSELPPEYIKKLQKILGRDRELDKITLNPENIAPETAFGVISRVNTSLNRGRELSG